MTLTIRLLARLDPAEPELQAEVVKGYRRAVHRVRVLTDHPVWRGAELEKGHFRIVKERTTT